MTQSLTDDSCVAIPSVWLSTHFSLTPWMLLTGHFHSWPWCAMWLAVGRFNRHVGPGHTSTASLTAIWTSHTRRLWLFQWRAANGVGWSLSNHSYSHLFVWSRFHCGLTDFICTTSNTSSLERLQSHDWHWWNNKKSYFPNMKLRCFHWKLP